MLEEAEELMDQYRRGLYQLLCGHTATSRASTEIRNITEL